GIPPNCAAGYLANAVAIGRGSNIDTQAESLKVLPPPNACGKGSPAIFTVGSSTATANCTLATGVQFNSLNTNAAQTLALGYNIKLTPGSTNQPLGAFVTASCPVTVITATGLATTDTVNTAFSTAVGLINGSASGGTTTQAKLTAMTALLNC